MSVRDVAMRPRAQHWRSGQQAQRCQRHGRRVPPPQVRDVDMPEHPGPVCLAIWDEMGRAWVGPEHDGDNPMREFVRHGSGQQQKPHQDLSCAQPSKTQGQGRAHPELGRHPGRRDHGAVGLYQPFLARSSSSATCEDASARSTNRDCRTEGVTRAASTRAEGMP